MVLTPDIKIVECPRDAMQGIHHFIPTADKIRYINQLLKVGFDTIDFGSFVSPKAIPQMADTVDVLRGLDLSNTRSKLLSIVANTRGAKDAAGFEEIQYIGFPFSISETFQLRNTNSTIEESLHTVSDILEICAQSNKEPVIYLSMGFGNPYGDMWNADIVTKWVSRLVDMGTKILSISDTVGIANSESISYLFKNLIPAYPDVELGAHFHSHQNNWREKVDAAYKFGCRRFDCAVKGYGGCPMAKDDLTGNLPTENLISYANGLDLETGLDYEAFFDALVIVNEIFPK